MSEWDAYQPRTLEETIEELKALGFLVVAQDAISQVFGVKIEKDNPYGHEADGNWKPGE